MIWIGGLQVTGLYFHGLWSGKLFDRGYLRLLIAAGSAVYVLWCVSPLQVQSRAS